ncbi:MAG: hypothetical protein IJJ23_06825 [Clostridia bacterium]|nr:hypothetical protein [Clostridia bacterium]
MLVGIDVGGTKNELVLCENDGRVLRHMVTWGSNASEYGEERACETVAAQVHLLTDGYDEADVDALYAGMAGGAAPQSRKIIHGHLTRLLPQIQRIDNGSDALNGLYAGLGVRDGMVVIAGTGTSAFVRRGSTLEQVGGWGYMIDDAGGGYALGRAVLNAAYRDYDGRGESTALTALCEEKLGCELPKGIPALYRGGKRYIADFALLAFQAAEEGDEVALDIVGWTCDELALLIRTCAQHLEDTPYQVALTGSIWKNDRLLTGVSHRLGEAYHLIKPQLPPVYGALLAAADMIGIRGDEAFRHAFSESIQTVKIMDGSDNA